MGGGIAGGPGDRRRASVVSDSSPLIGLDRIGRLDLLPAVYGTIVVPPAVARELGPLIIERWLVVQNVIEVVDPRVEQARLDPGEREAIALAMETNAMRLILDELPARRLATGLGLRVVGTVGVLLVAKESGLVAEVRPHLAALRATGFRVGAGVVAEALDQAGEAG